jgi:hypothetical protein
VTEARLSELRHLVRRGELPKDLLDELRAVGRRMARLRLLPPSFAPYGEWNDEAAEEIVASWYADRLLGHGQLQALLDRASSPGGFRRLAERSLSQHVLNAQDRSQARNLFRRLVAMLEGEPAFTLIQDANRPQDRWYGLAEWTQKAALWAEDDRRLVGHTWALGDFAVVRYRAGAAKLSPVLDAGELERFAAGLMTQTATGLTPNLIMRALSARFDLGEVILEELEETPPGDAGDLPADVAIVLRDTARFIILELSARQAEVVERTASEETVAEMARALGCSVGTIINEQRRVGELVTHVSADDDERDQLLNVVVDLLYSLHDE